MPGAEKLPADEGVSPSEEKLALDDLFSLVYEELRRLASFVRRKDRNATLSSAALLHEAWMKLKDSPSFRAQSVPHFKAIAAKAMRQVLLDEVRRRSARKRGGGGEVIVISLDESSMAIASCDQELLTLDKALDELARVNPRQSRVVESRFFGGMSVAEIASLLEVSESVIERDWRAARAWLANQVRPGKD